MYKPGSVVLIKMHPSSGQELKKFRPAIVIQSHATRKFITFIPLTSQTKTSFLYEHPISPSKKNGLEKNSLALCWYIQTVGTVRIQKQLGNLTIAEFQKIEKMVKKYLAS